MNLNTRQTDALHALLAQRRAVESEIVKTCRAYLVSADVDPDEWDGRLNTDDATGAITLVLKEPADG